MPKVSIITPTYNRAAYLAEAIESVLAQTFDDWEMIIVDDGSTDNTKSTVTSFMNKDSRICYYEQDHGGVAKARSRATEIACSKYVAYLDDDDCFYPEKLEKQTAYLDQHPETGIVYSYVDVVDHQKQLIKAWPDVAGSSFEDFLEQCTVQPNAALFRRDCIVKCGGCDASLKGCDDYDLILRLSLKYPFHFLPIRVGTYRQHFDRMSSNKLNRIKNNLAVCEKILKQDLSPQRKEKLSEKCSLLSYEVASYVAGENSFREALSLYTKAVRFDPLVGLKVRWSKFENILYRFLRPYLAIGYCGICSIPGKLDKKRSLDEVIV